MDIRGFHHLAMQVRDIEGQAAFYREVLGLVELARHRREDGTVRAVWLGLPEGGFLALEEVAEEAERGTFRHQRPGLFLLALRIAPEDRAAVLAELDRRRVPVVHQTRWTVYFQDPEGNRIGLSHHPHEPGQGGDRPGALGFTGSRR